MSTNEYYDQLDEAFKCIHDDLVDHSKVSWKESTAGVGSFRAWKLEIKPGFNDEFSRLTRCVEYIEGLISQHFNNGQIFISRAEYHQAQYIYVALSYKRMEDK